MILTVSGNAGSGKSTLARGLASRFQLKHYSMGDMMRRMAVEKKVSLEALSALFETDDSYDRELDHTQMKLGQSEDNFIIDGRLSAFFIPQAIKIYVFAQDMERAERIFRDQREIEKSSSVAEALHLIQEREKSEIFRYQSWYGFNPYNPQNYDIVFDSTHVPPEEMIHLVAEDVTTKLKSQLKESY